MKLIESEGAHHGGLAKVGNSLSHIYIHSKLTKDNSVQKSILQNCCASGNLSQTPFLDALLADPSPFHSLLRFRGSRKKERKSDVSFYSYAQRKIDTLNVTWKENRLILETLMQLVPFKLYTIKRVFLLMI